METVVLIDCDSLLYKNMEDLDEYKDRVDKIISEVIYKCQATHYRCFIEGFGNYTFRKILNSSYKSNRKSKPLPVNYNEIKQYIMEVYDPFISVGVESDDSVITTWRYLLDNFPLTDVYIAGNDKDYLTFPVKYIDLYYGRYLAMEDISEEDANYNFVYQMLVGDVADGVKCVKGLGDAKAKRLLKPIKNHWISYCKLLLKAYKESYGSYRKAKREVLNNFLMLRLRDNCRPSLDFTEVYYED